MLLLMIPFILQGAAMFFDEVHFHRKRGLPRWERIGHPIDSFFVFLCYLFIYLKPANATNMNIYIGLCIFSCLLITKDEFIHTEKCEATENWLHSVLFILHPITFLAAGIMWRDQMDPTFLLLQPIVIFIFILYQIIYWRSYETNP